MKKITIIVMITFLLIVNMVSISTATIMTGVWTDSRPDIDGFDGVFETKSLSDGSFGLGDESLGSSTNPYWSFEGLIRNATVLGPYTYTDADTRYASVTITRTSGEFELIGEALFGDPTGTVYTGKGESTYTGISYYEKNDEGKFVYASTSGVSVMKGVFDDDPFSFILTSTVNANKPKIEKDGLFYYPGFLTNVTLEIEPIPEPATMFLFGLGLLGLAGVSRRKK